MTFQKMLEDLSSSPSKSIQLSNVKSFLEDKEYRKIINYFIHHDVITKEPLNDNELMQLQSIVQILQILYNSDIGSPISDEDYDILQEMLVNMGIPRLTGTVEINDANKVHHSFTMLRGTLDKVYYLTEDEERKNKSRKSLDEWIKRTEALYKSKTGKSIDLNDCIVALQPKFDGVSVILEVKNGKALWLTRGNTKTNLASDVSHIMRIFNDVFAKEDCGVKFEVMIPEESMSKINTFYREHPYQNSRQIVISTLNSNEVDFKSDYLVPIPLRSIYPGQKVEHIHDMLPVKLCKLSDRDAIRAYAAIHRYWEKNGRHFRTDGVVITLVDEELKEILGRRSDINNFEVAYKFTEEVAQTKIIAVEFETSPFGFISPVAIFNPVMLKGNIIKRAALSNRDRFEELDLHKGDTVNISYDIIPYLTKPKQNSKGYKIEFIKKCPSCGEKLDLSQTMVQCKNPDCKSRVLGRILNYCEQVRIQNIGLQIIKQLHDSLLLEDGIRSLYKLHKKKVYLSSLYGFGAMRANKIISEIESKRKLRDDIFFGALGITGLSTKTFTMLFKKIDSDTFIEMIKNKQWRKLKSLIVQTDGLGEIKANLLLDYFGEERNRKELLKLLKEVTLIPTNGNAAKGIVVFSGFRPAELMEMLEKNGWEISNSLTKNTKYLVVKNKNASSAKIEKAKSYGTQILSEEEAFQLR